MARSPSDKETPDIRWELVETRDRFNRSFYRQRPKVGAVFGKLTVVLGRAGSESFTDCICDCGEPKTIVTNNLRRGKGVQCRKCAGAEMSALRRKNTAYFKEYAVGVMWQHRYTGMVRRCYNPKCPEYRNYGARGITVCKEWMEDRTRFFEYATTLADFEKLGVDMDRINNDGNYEPGNIRLCDRKTNARNRRGNVKYEFRGAMYTQAELLETFFPAWGSVNSFAHHIKNGRTIEWILAKHDEGRKCLRSPELRLTQ